MLDTGDGATPFTRCSTSNCKNGNCTDPLQCTCNAGWAGSACDIALSTPTSPGTNANGPSGAKTSGAAVILTCLYLALGAGILYFL